ncbi:hypothetical protein HDG32_007310 [Paraburkholderia sp. CI2]|nr:hypothetical protein [Paraburkholderia sp. CI2]
MRLRQHRADQADRGVTPQQHGAGCRQTASAGRLRTGFVESGTLLPLEKLITAARYSKNQIAVRAEYLSQCGEMHLYVVLFDNGVGPDCIHQLVFRDEAPTGGSDHGKNVERAGSDMHDFAVLPQSAHFQIDQKAADFDHRVIRFRMSQIRKNARGGKAFADAGFGHERTYRGDGRASCTLVRCFVGKSGAAGRACHALLA